MSTPTTALLNLDKVRETMNTMSLAELVNHDFIRIQLSLSFGAMGSHKIEQFKSNYLVLVSDPKIIERLKNVDNFSLLNSLISLTKDGLSINPLDKEAVIANYNGRAVPIATAKGKVKKMQQNGIIDRIQYLELIYENDQVSNKNGVWEHSINIKRPDDEPAIGVLLMALMPDSTIKSKFVRASEIKKRQDKAPFPEIWKEWPEEMWKKTAINMFEKEIGFKPVFLFHKEEEAEGDFNSQQFTQDTNYSSDIPDGDNTEPVAPEIITQDPKRLEELNKLLSEKLLTDHEEAKLRSVLPSLKNDKIDNWIKALNLRKENKAQNTPQPPEPPVATYNVNGEGEPKI